ncbi:hypothetical protein [Rhodopirellula sp. MGV]|uniref:hypothetical protein n=1 Tax=Rhodopirellula sp. MGV TaxID=2023130 RepID=UPI000B966959|nr:hypothetical protein [Rhodopirellula sp. MGV]OYP38163.1 hypothetical protein CGZ80_02735 [Rhodopirellula sp. MGV]PNY34920.1 hypothetical protein C2E31_20890 [Rhodopirellula baltica]
MISQIEFARQFTTELKRDYLRDNQWFAKVCEDWTQEDILTELINAAYKLYVATASNALKLTVLGGTEIRMDSQLVRSFGVTAANGIQDEKTREIVQKELLRRSSLAKSRNDAATRMPPRLRRINRVTKVGSILSERRWSPILNDTLIIGAITGRQHFVLALTENEQRAWELQHDGKFNKFSVARSTFDKNECKQAWKEFLQQQTQMFFDDNYGNPRVFARELIGLCTFGYKPEFSWHQLGFSYSNNGEHAALNFRNYVQALANINFQDADRTSLLEKLGEFLFEDRTALTHRRAADLVG